MASANADAMSLLNTHADTRRNIATAIAGRWTNAAVLTQPQSPHVFGTGTGDGNLLRDVLAQLAVTADVTLVEPDDFLAPRAVITLTAGGHQVALADGRGSRRPVDLYLAAHVLFYVNELQTWMAGAVESLAPNGLLTCVIPAKNCAGSGLRGLVREHRQQPVRVAHQRLVTLGAQHGLTHDKVDVISTVTYPAPPGPYLAAVPEQSPDPELARLLCWIMGLPEDQEVEAALLQALNERLAQHTRDGLLTLALHDVVLTFYTEVP